MLAFLVDLFPQAAGSHSSPPPRALFEDFFGSSVPPSLPIYLSWFERVCTALADVDTRLASFLSSVRSDFSFLPPRNSSSAVKGDFASGQAVPVNSLLLLLYEKQLKPSYHVGLTVQEAAALESSLRCQALSHSMWVLSGLLGFVRLQNFAPADMSLFNTLVTLLSKSLARQASLCASHTAFLVLKHRHFYLSHLPAYFSDTNKRSMLEAPVVCSDFLFAEAGVARLLSDTQTALSLKSLQVLVDVGQHWRVLESWGADRWVVEVLLFGYRVPFLASPLSNVPISLPSRGLALTAVVADLHEKGAIKLAPPSPGYYSRFFVTPKVTGGWWPVIDLSRLNQSVRVSHFHMEIQQSALQSLRLGDWMASLVLKDAYLQVPVHPESRCYQRFCVGEEVWQFRALCYGFSTAQQAFTRVMAPISSIMHRHGFRILRYLDDWLVLGSSFQNMVRARNFLLWLFRELGVQVNLEKSSLTPSQTLDYLGMQLQTLPLSVFPTPKRVLKLASLLSNFTSCHLQPLTLWHQLL